MTGKNVIKAAIDKMTELDAAGWALVLLRCDREADIRRTVCAQGENRGLAKKGSRATHFKHQGSHRNGDGQALWRAV